MVITVRYFGYNENGLHSCAVFKGMVPEGDGKYIEGTKKELNSKVEDAIKAFANGKPVKAISKKKYEIKFEVLEE